MAGKRLQLARSLMASGAHRIVARRDAPSLLVLNYHRLRARADAGPSQFDDGVFDTDVETFRRQMLWLKSATTVLGEDDLLELGGKIPLRRGALYSLVTFDDGYVDCYTLARKVLDEVGIRGIFFLPFDLLESRRLGWWDVAAYLLKSTERRSICVDGRDVRSQARLCRVAATRPQFLQAGAVRADGSAIGEACGHLWRCSADA